MKKNLSQSNALLKLLLGVFLASYASISFAQQPLQTSGKVMDSLTREPLPGVSVKIQSKQTGTTTNSEGVFSIPAERGDVLIFSAVGYKQKAYQLHDQVAVQIA